MLPACGNLVEMHAVPGVEDVSCLVYLFEVWFIFAALLMFGLYLGRSF